MQDKESPPKEGLKNLTSLEKLEIFCNVPIWCRFPKGWVASHLSLRAKMPERNWWDWARFLTSQKFSISLGFGLNYCSTTYMLIYAPLDVFFFNCLNQTFLFLNFIHLLQYWCFGQFICNSLNKILEAQHELLNGSLAKKGRLPKIAHILKCSGNLLPSVQYHKSIWNAFFIFWVLVFTAHFLVNPLPSFCFLNFGLWK